eukprot:GHVH01000943.1.p1 GENE.GHVH01000943.1~~GHVH01000943.1.p1  ORF type:complete len:813 (+),score=138.97 GHVH01000943.1:72-2510(+)
MSTDEEATRRGGGDNLEGCYRSDDHQLQYVLSLKKTIDWNDIGALVGMTTNVLKTLVGGETQDEDKASNVLVASNNQTASKEIERLLAIIGFTLHTTVYKTCDECYDAAIMEHALDDFCPEDDSAWPTHGPALVRPNKDTSLPVGYVKDRLREDSDLIVCQDVRDQMVASYRSVFMAMLLDGSVDDDAFSKTLTGKYSSHVIQTLISVAPICMVVEALQEAERKKEDVKVERHEDPSSPPPRKKAKHSEKKKPLTTSLSVIEMICSVYERVNCVFTIRGALLTDRASYVVRALLHVLAGYHPFRSAVEMMELTNSTASIGNRKKDIQKKGKSKKNDLVDGVPQERFLVWHPRLRAMYSQAIASLLTSASNSKSELSDFFHTILGPPAFQFILQLLEAKAEVMEVDNQATSDPIKKFVESTLQMRKKKCDQVVWNMKLDAILESCEGSYYTLQGCVECADEAVLRKFITSYLMEEDRMVKLSIHPRGNYVVQAVISALGAESPSSEVDERVDDNVIEWLVDCLSPVFGAILKGGTANVALKLLETVRTSGTPILRRRIIEVLFAALELDPTKKESQSLGWISILSLMTKSDIIRHLDQAQERLSIEKDTEIKLANGQKYSKELLSVPFLSTGLNVMKCLIQYPKVLFVSRSYNEFTKWRTVIDQLGRDRSGSYFLQWLLETRQLEMFQDKKKGCDIDRIIRVVKGLMESWWTHMRASFVIGAAFRRCEVDPPGILLRTELIKALIPTHTDECKGNSGACRGCPSLRSRASEVHRRNMRLYEMMRVALYKSDQEKWRESWSKEAAVEKEFCGLL